MWEMLRIKYCVNNFNQGSMLSWSMISINVSLIETEFQLLESKLTKMKSSHWEQDRPNSISDKLSQGVSFRLMNLCFVLIQFFLKSFGFGRFWGVNKKGSGGYGRFFWERSCDLQLFTIRAVSRFLSSAAKFSPMTRDFTDPRDPSINEAGTFGVRFWGNTFPLLPLNLIVNHFHLPLNISDLKKNLGEQYCFSRTRLSQGLSTSKSHHLYFDRLCSLVQLGYTLQVAHLSYSS